MGGARGARPNLGDRMDSPNYPGTEMHATVPNPHKSWTSSPPQSETPSFDPGDASLRSWWCSIPLSIPRWSRRLGAGAASVVAGCHPFVVSARGDPRWPRLGSSMLSPRLVMRRSCVGLRFGRVFIETGGRRTSHLFLVGCSPLVPLVGGPCSFRTRLVLPPSAALQWGTGVVWLWLSSFDPGDATLHSGGVHYPC